MTDSSSNPYEQERRVKRDRLREIGVNPYGQRIGGLTPLAGIRDAFKPEFGHDAGPVFKAAGRIMLKRDMGKLSFITIRDDTGDLQIGLDKKRLSEQDWQVNELLDLGDQIVVEGPLGTTRKGEITIWASSVAISCKALLPPPAKWEGLSDVELRYRQRYVDLWANPEVMKLAKLRIRIVEEVRAFLRGRGFVEVETPMMQTLHGGANARPFVTKMNALDLDLYMRIAPELFLKRLLVGGMPKIFELNRNFRNEGMSPRHNPEFTMLEAYEAYGSWETMAELIESMICHVAMSVFGVLKIVHLRGEEVRTINLEGDLSKPTGYRWPRRSMAELVEEKTGWRFAKEPIPNDKLRELRDANPGKDLKFHNNPAEQLVEVYEKLVEPTLVNPCFVTRVPSVIIPLARPCADDPFFADVYELAINGVEISPGYTELNDPDIQAEQFRRQVGDKEEQQKHDEDFINALKYGMPPAGGMGMGIDRLVMMLTGAESIRDVILFPLMKPVEG
jgi:lysyl-tRNA synthetase class 2